MLMQLQHIRSAAAILASGAILALPVAAACATGGGRHVPTLSLTHRDPVSVTGSHFTARARVTVTVVAATTQSRRLRADRHGSFTAAFSTVIDRCTSWSVSATQPGRGIVRISGHAKPQCAPAGVP
jgi:hypothetical protein